MAEQSDNYSITLYFRQAGSDKVYHAAIEPAGDGYVVNFAFGRRGATMQTGTKTESPAPLEKAKKIFDKLVSEKTAKGYTPGEDGTPYVMTDKAERATGIVPQLLNSIDEGELEKFIADDRWWMQEKFDGRRVLIQKKQRIVTAINRTGLTTGLPESIVKAIQSLKTAECLLDGEAIGDVYYAFDLLNKDGADIKASGYSVRHAMMIGLGAGPASAGLRFVDAAKSTAKKRSMLEKLKLSNKEGAVFKDSLAPYTPGRPASGGSQVKLKFYATASCIVARTNGARRSVALELIGAGGRVGVGNVTIPANQNIPKAGVIVEIRYLYAYAGGSLYQPVYLGVRDDIEVEACVMAQLKLKAGEEEAE